MRSLRTHWVLLIFLPGRCARPALCGFSSAGSAASALAHRVEVTTLLRDRCYAVHDFGVKGFRVGYFAPSVFLLRFLRYPLRLLGLRHPLYPSYIQTEDSFSFPFGYFLHLFTFAHSYLLSASVVLTPISWIGCCRRRGSKRRSSTSRAVTLSDRMARSHNVESRFLWAISGLLLAVINRAVARHGCSQFDPIVSGVVSAERREADQSSLFLRIRSHTFRTSISRSRLALSQLTRWSCFASVVSGVATIPR